MSTASAVFALLTVLSLLLASTYEVLVYVRFRKQNFWSRYRTFRVADTGAYVLGALSKALTVLSLLWAFGAFITF